MIEISNILCTVLAFVILITSEGSKFEMSGFAGAFALLGIISFKQIHKYNEIKLTFSNSTFKLKRHNFIGEILNCIIMVKGVYKANCML